MTATPNHALQRTATAVTARASATAFPPAMHGPRQPPPSLSLGSLGVSSRLVRTKTLAFACSALFLVGCASVSPSAQHPSQPSPFDSQSVRSLRWLDSADPQRDLTAALARGDTRFIGVYGYAPFTPGVERSVVSRHGIRYLSGTSDAIQGHEHLRLNLLASSYAERYNKLLLQRLKQ